MPACSCVRCLLAAQRFRLLRLVGVLAPRVDLQMTELGCSELVVAEHPAYGTPDNLLRPPVEEMPERLGTEAARVAAVACIRLRLALVAGDGDTGGVDDDDVIARVEIGLPGR